MKNNKSNLNNSSKAINQIYYQESFFNKIGLTWCNKNN